MKRLALFTCFLLAWLPARAQETWVCAYTWSSPDQTVIRKFQVNGADLIDSSQTNVGGDFIASSEKFSILQNNSFGIVAARSFAEIERNEPAIGAFVVLIDKQNGKFQLSNAILGEPQAVTGTCTK
jgi:hypothetical protein